MLKIRHAVFETNSSSTHSIVVSDVPLEEYEYDSFIHFEIGNFGWKMDVLNDSWERASYFYTAACEVYERDVKDEIIELLVPLGIECHFSEENAPRFETYGDDKYKYLDNGSIDHVDECKPFVDALMNDADMLARFLLSDKSFVVTSNDNVDDVDRTWYYGKIEKANAYPHEIFYKGN